MSILGNKDSAKLVYEGHPISSDNGLVQQNQLP